MVHEASKAHEALQAGEVPVTKTVSHAEVHEDRQAGMEEDGITVMALGDHPDGKALDTILAMVPIMDQAGDQAGYPFPITRESQSRFPSRMVRGAVLLTDQTSTLAPITTTVQASFTTQAVTISVATTIKTMSGTITRVAFMTTTTPKVATTWTVNTMKMVFGSMMTLAPWTKTMKVMKKMIAKKGIQLASMRPHLSETIEAIKRRLQMLRPFCQTQLWQTRLM
jgi:hypothetical protein